MPSPTPPPGGGPRQTAAPGRLELTGERTAPGHDGENYWFRRHEVAYETVAPLVGGLVVCEAGCGEGYGAAALAARAAQVLAVELDAAAAAHAARTYPVLAVVRGDLQRLPMADGSVDVVVTLQVLEHLHDQAGFLAECARVLRPEGLLALSTPNRSTFSPGSRPGEPPVNPFHTRETDPAELLGLLGRRFDVTALLGVRHGPRLAALDGEHDPGPDQAPWGHRGLVGAQLRTEAASWPGDLTTAVASVRTDDFVVEEAGPDVLDAQALDLLALARPRPA